MKKSPVSYRLGIDLGTNSLGFALVELKDDKPMRPIHMGVRIFSDGREAKTGTSLAVDRRTARGMRRRRDRLLRRQQMLMEELINSGLMPQDKMERKKLELLDPYFLRQKGLYEKLTPYELGRALFHLNQRRGFQSNRKQVAKDKDAGAIRSAGEKLEGILQEQGYRTIGEFLYKNPVKRVRPNVQGSKSVYGFYPQRDMLKAEYDLLMITQASYHSELLVSQLVEELKDTIFFHRPLRPVLKGRCSLLPEKQRAYAALPSSQRFRILKEVNNLEILDKLWRRNQTHLTDEQCKKVVAELYKKKNVSFDGLRRTLKLDSSTVFNLESEQREKLQGAETSIELSKNELFGEIWNTLNLVQQDEIVEKLLDDHIPDEEVVSWLERNFPTLSPTQIKSILNVSLEDGTLRYSSEAIHNILSYLEEGKNEHDAREMCVSNGLFPNARKEKKIVDELPYYGELLETHVAFGTGDISHAPEKRYGKIPNPTVHIALNQVCRLINELMGEFGRPAEIAIELSRDLKLNKKEKQRLLDDIKKNTKANEKYDEQIRTHSLTPSNEYRLRLKLHEQQRGLCAYSGKTISITDLLGDGVEIDHILPFARTLDDTAANKVVVFRELNRIKGNKSPFEAFANHKEINYTELQARVSSFPASKKWRFLPDAMKRFEEESKSGDAGWLARQLNDTSYMARVAREYLRYVVGDHKSGLPKVDTYPGGVTAKLRRGWGFNSLINPGRDEKNRDDHRHHAIDALVIGCANRSLLQQISRSNATDKAVDEEWYKNLMQKAPPYAGFDRTTLQTMVDNIVVSHKPDHGSPGQAGSTSGRLHEDTFYGKSRIQRKLQNREEIKEGQIRLHVRKPLASLLEKDIADIVDDTLRRKVAEAMGNSGEKKYEEAIVDFARTNNIRRVRVFVEKSEKAMKAINDKQGKPYRYVATGGNHHIDIYCPIKDNKALKIKEGRWYAETVSTFDANQKDFAPQWRKDHPTAKLVMRLHINDMIAYEESGKRVIWRVQKLDGYFDAPFIIPHLDAQDKRSRKATAKQLQEWNARKIAVTPAGKILDPGKAPMPKPFRINPSAVA